MRKNIKFQFFHKKLRYVLCTLCVLMSESLSAETLMLPTLLGTYSVGMKSINLTDPKRKAIRGTEQKQWVISAFYPTKDHSEKMPYMSGTLDHGEVEGIKVLSHAKLEAPSLKDKRFPVIFFIPGRGEERQKYTILLENIASNGFVVLAMDQPYVANFVKFSDGKVIVPTFHDLWHIRRNRDCRYQYDDKAIEGAIGDIKYVLDHQNDLGDLSTIYNFDKTILMGHSLGGNIAHNLGFSDFRIHAIVDIDSKITDRKVYGNVGVPENKTNKPVLFIRGMMQYQEDVGDSLHKISNATVWEPMVEHSAFSDNAFFADKIDDFGTSGIIYNFLNWFFERGPYFSRIDTNLGKYDGDQWYKDYCSRVINWLKKTI